MIVIENLKKQFGETVACDIPALEIKDREILGLVGNNGAGKTTLFRMLLDLLKPDTGTVALDGINPAESEAWKDKTGAYIDDSFLIEFLTPEEYFAFLGKISGLSQEEVDNRLKPFERFASGEIFGQKNIAALFYKPQLVILDEPFNFLDPSSQNILKHVLTDYNKETGATILISSHNLQHTIDISTRITLLEKGVVIKDLSNAKGSAKTELENYFETEA